ncbi:MAG: sulfatase [Desulfatibacillum sp.]|nr:sulfatase [Desulfatibacillum sp.]
MGEPTAKDYGREASRKWSAIQANEGYTRRDILRWGALCGLAGALPMGLTGAGCSHLRALKPRHVVLISMDTLRRDHLPIYGYSRQTAPHISELARTSVIFDNAIAAASNTAPSHASMLTGLHPLSHGVRYNWAMLSQDVPTLGEILQGQGFSTGAFVSCIALHSQTTGLNRGFDTYNDVGPLPGHRRAADTFRDTVQWLDSVQKGQQIFLFFHVFDPHFPYSAPVGQTLPGWGYSGIRKGLPLDYPAMREKMRQGFSHEEIQAYVNWYDEEILYADMYVGRLLKALQDKGIYEDSLIIFLSDHGETLGERPWMFDHGGRVVEEQIQVPLLMRFPGGWGQGARINSPAHHVDLTPTILDALGLPPAAKMEGASLLPAVKGLDEGIPRFQISMAKSDPERCPEIQDIINKNQPVFAIRHYPHKLVRYPGLDDKPILRLFDLEADPMETIDLSLVQLAIAKDLQQRLEAWIRQCRTKNQKFKEKTLSPEVEKSLRSLGYLS